MLLKEYQQGLQGIVLIWATQKIQSGITGWRLWTWNITNGSATNGSATNLEHNWGLEGQAISKFHD